MPTLRTPVRTIDAKTKEIDWRFDLLPNAHLSHFVDVEYDGRFINYFKSVSAERGAEIVGDALSEKAARLLSQISVALAAQILNYVSVSKAADIINEMPLVQRTKDIFDALSDARKDDICPLLDASHYDYLCVREFIIDSMTFKYRRKITITEQSGSDLTDYQVLIELNSTNFDFSHAQTNGEDIRFTDANGNLLDYWIEEWDAIAEEAIIWVKVPSIPANSSLDIFLYYGNSEVPSASDVIATFIRVIDGLVASWHLDEGSGIIAKDTSGNGYDLTIHGAEWVDGVFKKALSFDGDDDYADVDMPQDFCEEGSSFSVELRVKSSDTAAGEMLISNYPDGSVGPYFGFYTRSDGLVGFNHRDSGGNKVAPVSTTNVMDGSWHHLVGVRDVDAGRSRIYVDKVKEDDVEDNTGDCSNAYKVTLMLHYNSYYHAGVLDEIRIYNKSLSDEEISDLCDNYGYTTTNYPGKVLVRKYTEPEPSVSVGAEE